MCTHVEGRDFLHSVSGFPFWNEGEVRWPKGPSHIIFAFLLLCFPLSVVVFYLIMGGSR